METEIKQYNFPMLTSTNCAHWKFKMEVILKEMDCYNIVNGTEKEPEGRKKADFERRSDKAFRTIILNVADEFLGVISSSKNCTETWQALIKNFERNCLSNQMTLWKQFVYLKYKNGDSMQGHINKLIELTNRLAACGQKIS